MLVAAEGTFTAEKRPGLWNFKLDLKSRGIVETTFPIRSLFSSRIQEEPWRSLRFLEDRQEGSQKKKRSTSLNYQRREGVYEDAVSREKNVFSIKSNSLEDMGSMLYALRRHPWEKVPEWRFEVQDRWKTKVGVARVIRKEKVEGNAGQEREAWMIEVRELDQEGNIRKNRWLNLWISSDVKRIPLIARARLAFGTFTIKLKDT
jgi:hypothetical protein